MRSHLPLLLCAALTAPALLQGCDGADTPETQVRQALERMELAAEARDVRDFLQHVSAHYRDARGHDRTEIGRYLRGYFIANQQIRLLTRIERLEFPSRDEARAEVLVGMLGREADAADAWNLAADLHRFDVVLVREGGEWQITWAEW